MKHIDENVLSQNIKSIDTSEIRKIFDLTKKLKNPINLSIGQPDFPVPFEVKEAFTKAIQDNYTAYSETQGILPLREALSQKWLDDSIHIAPDNILVSTGVASLLMLLFAVLFNPKDQILLLDPYFIIYETLSNYHQLDKLYLPESFTNEELQQLEPKIKNLKMIIFANPSNPTGKILSNKQLNLLANLAHKYGALIIADEIYEAYDYEQKMIHIASLLPKQTITLSGFSKSHAMTGCRVGYMGVPSNLRFILNKVATLQQYSIVCSPQPSQWAALKALDVSIKQQINTMKNRRDLVIKHLEGDLEFTYPDGAFYIFLYIPIHAKVFIEKAIQKQLLIVPGHIFSKNPNTIRLSYATNNEQIIQGIRIIKEILA